MVCKESREGCKGTSAPYEETRIIRTRKDHLFVTHHSAYDEKKGDAVEMHSEGVSGDVCSLEVDCLYVALSQIV